MRIPGMMRPDSPPAPPTRTRVAPAAQRIRIQESTTVVYDAVAHSATSFALSMHKDLLTFETVVYVTFAKVRRKRCGNK